jgi:hypothetical protein
MSLSMPKSCRTDTFMSGMAGAAGAAGEADDF